MPQGYFWKEFKWQLLRTPHELGYIKLFARTQQSAPVVECARDEQCDHFTAPVWSYTDSPPPNKVWAYDFGLACGAAAVS